MSIEVLAALGSYGEPKLFWKEWEDGERRVLTDGETR